MLAGARKTKVLMPRLPKAQYRPLKLVRAYKVLRITTMSTNRLRLWVTDLTEETEETGLKNPRFLVTRFTACEWWEVSVCVEPDGWQLSRLTVVRICVWAVLEMLGELPTIWEMARRSILVSPVILNTDGCPSGPWLAITSFNSFVGGWYLRVVSSAFQLTSIPVCL